MTAEAPLCLPPAPLSRRPSASLPAGTCDCHFHVFKADAPLVSPRNYTPQPMTIADWEVYADTLGISRGVIVQPSVYGLDNRVLVEALEARPGRLRGVVVIEPDAPRPTLRLLHSLGVRGVRVNTRNLGGLPLDAVSTLAGAIADLGWHLQLQVNEAGLEALQAIILQLPVEVVIDHMGHAGVDDPARRSQDIDRLLRLLATGRAWVKLSAPYRLGSDTEAVAGIAQRLVGMYPGRLIWGSDWPHTELWNSMPDDADLIEEAMGWLANPALARKVLVENPKELYWTDQP
ncbi:amidohydrolase family protein [Pseudochelatococcus sp. B33]